MGVLYTYNEAQGVARHIMTFPEGANGTTPVLFELNTQSALSPTFDSAGNLWVVHGGEGLPTGEVRQYAPGASDNAIPLRVIAGPNTQLGSVPNSASGVAVDQFGYIYVSAGNGTTMNRILVFAPGSSGDVAPIRVITGPATLIPAFIITGAIDVNASGEIAVGTGLPGRTTLVFAPGANGNVPPAQVIPGEINPAGGLPKGIFETIFRPSTGELYTTQKGNGTIVVYAKNGSGQYVPVRRISNTTMRLAQSVNQIAFDEARGSLFISDFFGGTISEYPIGANGDEVPPITVIHAPPGPATSQISAGMALSRCAAFGARNIYLVPPGSTCALVSQTIGTSKVAPGAGLVIQSSTINGSLDAGGAAGIRICGSTINGSVRTTGARSVVLGEGPNCAPNVITGRILR